VKFKGVAKVDINGRKWEIGYGHPGLTDGTINDGICDYDKRRITIYNRCTRSLLSVLAHEILHARLHDISEEAVDECGELISKVYDIFTKQSTRHGRGGSVV